MQMGSRFIVLARRFLAFLDFAITVTVSINLLQESGLQLDFPQEILGVCYEHPQIVA
jgi:hypothetical protein